MQKTPDKDHYVKPDGEEELTSKNQFLRFQVATLKI